MKVIYIAGKFRGPDAWAVEQNIRRAEERGFDVAQMGASPLIPHTNTRFFNGTLTEQFWLDATLAAMLKCDAVLTVDNWSNSQGAIEEVRVARERDMPVFHSLWELQQWLDKVGR